jgi:hypothetical protein
MAKEDEQTDPGPAPKEDPSNDLVNTLLSLAKGAGRGLTTDAVGAPVDIINMLLGAVGLPVSEEPFGGSKHIRGLTNQPKEDTGTETVGNLLSAFVNPTTASTKVATILPLLGGIFMGEKSKTFSKGLAKTFEELEKAKTLPTKSFQLTNTHRGPLDQKLRQEISDLPAELEADLKALEDAGIEVVLRDVLKHDDLYDAYPDLAHINLKSKAGTGGNYNSDTDTIRIGLNQSPDDMLNVLLHEVQHAIQGKEGFVRGGNPSMMAASPAFQEASANLPKNSPKKQEEVGLLLNELYMRLGGEAEARAVQRRWLDEKAIPGSTINKNPLFSYDRQISDLLWPPQ